MGERQNEIMDQARFRQLTDAYGGRIERWPDNERIAAAAFAATSEGRRLLAAADRLDAMLDRYVVARPGAALDERILVAALRPRGIVAVLRSRWAGLGLVGVGLAGMATGAVAMMLVLTAPVPEDGLMAGDRIATVFGDIGEGRSDQGEMAK